MTNENDSEGQKRPIKVDRPIDPAIHLLLHRDLGGYLPGKAFYEFMLPLPCQNREFKEMVARISREGLASPFKELVAVETFAKVDTLLINWIRKKVTPEQALEQLEPLIAELKSQREGMNADRFNDSERKFVDGRILTLEYLRDRSIPHEDVRLFIEKTFDEIRRQRIPGVAGSRGNAPLGLG